MGSPRHPPPIMLMAMMGQQACLGSLFRPGIQQETSSEHLVALQRRQNQKLSFLNICSWKRPQRALGQPLGGVHFGILKLTFISRTTDSCLSQIQPTSSFSPLHLFPSPQGRGGAALPSSTHQPQVPRRAALSGLPQQQWQVWRKLASCD